jgi:hypothetical protein
MVQASTALMTVEAVASTHVPIATVVTPAMVEVAASLVAARSEVQADSAGVGQAVVWAT